MKELIRNKLKEIEHANGVKILYACESGSRAWGFPSPDSDYDVRIIYKHDLDWYLSIGDEKDTINLPIDSELDIAGWELRKMLRLLQKSNVSPLEWIQSPIVYMEQVGFVKTLKELCQEFFSPIAVSHHYLSMSKKYYDDCVSNSEVKLKRYFYALRTAMAGMWIREMGTMAPIEFPDMLMLVDKDVKVKILELIELKSGKNEDYLHKQEPLINEFLKETITENERLVNSMLPSSGKVERLNSFLAKTIKGS